MPVRRDFPSNLKQAIVLDGKTNKLSLQRLAEKYGVKSPSTIYKWSKHPGLFTRDGDPIPLTVEQRGKKKIHPGPKLKRPELEEYLYSKWCLWRDDGKAVTINLLICEIERFTNENGGGHIGFDAKRHVVTRFMDRYKLEYRVKTHTGTYLDEAEMAETIFDFVSGFHNLITDLAIPLCNVFNMDQTAVYYDNAPRRTIALRGSKSISIRTSNSASFRATVFLCVSFSGVKLRPLVIFKAKRDKTVHKNLKREDKDGCDPNLNYTVQHNAWCDQSVMCDWIENFNEETSEMDGLKLLLLDNFSVHCTKQTAGALAKGKTCLEMLPPNYTSKLQPLDVGINKPFKDRLRDLYIQHAAGTQGAFSVTRQIISNWIAQAWAEISIDTIMNTTNRIGFTYAT